MRKVKRVFAWLLVLVMVMTNLPVYAAAEQTTAPQVEVTGSNLLAPEICAEDPVLLMQADTSRSIDYLTIEEAALSLRGSLKSRQSEITLYVQVPQASVDTVWSDVYEQAVAHTGNPDEGDYIHYHVHQITATPTYTVEDGVACVTLRYTFDYWSTAEQEAEMDTAFASLMDQLNLSGKSDYQKILSIYHYLTANITYDYTHKDDVVYKLQQTAYAALLHKTCVCQGYANLFYRMALAAGLDCRIIAGTSNDENHAWNIVKLDGAYYNVDATWDAQGYQSGNTYGYFLRSESNFTDHTRDDKYLTDTFLAEYPMAASDYPMDVLTNQQDGNFQYSVTNGLATVTGYTGSDTDVTVPSTLGGYPVHTIGRGVFAHNNVIQSLTISEGIRKVTTEAIYYCYKLKAIHYSSTVQLHSFEAAGLSPVPYGCEKMETVTVAEGNTSVTVYDGVLYTKDMSTLLYLPPADPREVLQVPNGVTAIGSDSCRDNTNLKKVILPDTVESIGYWSFIHSSNLEEINIPDNCTFIGQYAFQDTALKSIHIPAMTEIVPGAFSSGCPLETITVDPENPLYYAVDNVLFQRAYDGIALIKYPAGNKRTSYSIPEGVKRIAQYSFSDAEYLEQVVLPEGIAKIETYAFENNKKLKRLEIPDSVQLIENSAFWGCTSLENITLPNGLTIIESTLFNKCSSLSEITIPEGVSKIERSAFENCGSLKKVVLPSTIKEIADYAFSGCSSLVEIKIPESVTSIGSQALAWCTKLAKITIPASVNSIASDAFYASNSGNCDVFFAGTKAQWDAFGWSVDSPIYVHYLCTSDQDHWQETVIPSTCKRYGYIQGHCSCGYGKVLRTLPELLDHTEETIPGKAATCTATGLTEGKKCTVCGKVTVEQGVTPLKSHTEVVVPGKEATCTETGLTEGKKCTVCGKFTVEQTVIPATGHTEETIPGRTTSCAETGLTAGKKCTVCGKITVEQETIPADSHRESTVPGKPATCTETGLTEGWKCIVCGKFTVEQNVIPATGHTEETIPSKAASCTETGLTEGKKCTVCGKFTVEQKVIPATGHTEETIPGRTTSCAETGLTEGKKCTVCGKFTVEQNVIPATGHTEETIPGNVATCSKTGLTEGKKCSVCGKFTVEQKVIPAIGHSEVTVPGKEAACYKTGLTEGKKCSVCGTVTVKQETIPVTGVHIYENDVCKHCGAAAPSVEQQLQDIQEKDAPKEVIREAVQSMESEQLTEILKEGGEAAENLAALEEKAGGAAEVVVGDSTTGIAAQDVQIVGANLNNVAEGKSAVLVISEAEKENTIPNGYEAENAVHISMTLENVADTKNLAVPVKITLPVPDGMNPSQVVVIHYHGNSTEVLEPVIVEVSGKYFVSVVLEGFSDFAITQKQHVHTYDDNVDGTCNGCGVNREDVESRQVVHMFRMYNPNTGEHFYTGSPVERDNLIAVGWQYEGVGFTFPANTGVPVHRLFQPSTGEHLYTMDENEKDTLMAAGWNYEGVAFNSAYDTEAVQHRLHNPNATVGAYHFTFSAEEKQNLIDAGWEYQGIGWYSCWK